MTWLSWWRASADEMRLLVEARQETVVEYEEETLSRKALAYDRSGTVGTHSPRSPRLHSGQAVQAWAKSGLPPGQALRKPAPLFKKLDEGAIEKRYARLEGQAGDQGFEFGDTGAGAVAPALCVSNDTVSRLTAITA